MNPAGTRTTINCAVLVREKTFVVKEINTANLHVEKCLATLVFKNQEKKEFVIDDIHSCLWVVQNREDA